jgi:hypothetical protein
MAQIRFCESFFDGNPIYLTGPPQTPGVRQSPQHHDVFHGQRPVAQGALSQISEFARVRTAEAG